MSSTEYNPPGGVWKDVILQNNIEHADLCGWLYDMAYRGRRWCVLADMLLCVFVSQTDNVPVRVVLVSGSRVIRTLYNTAKDDLLDTTSPDVRYQFLIEDCFKKTTCSFAADSQLSLDKWVCQLNVACDLDIYAFRDNTSVRMIPKCKETGGDGGHKSVGAIPTYIPTTEGGEHRLSHQCYSNCSMADTWTDNDVSRRTAFSKVLRHGARQQTLVADRRHDVTVSKPSRLHRQASFEAFKELVLKSNQVRPIKTSSTNVASRTRAQVSDNFPKLSSESVLDHAVMCPNQDVWVNQCSSSSLSTRSFHDASDGILASSPDIYLDHDILPASVSDTSELTSDQSCLDNLASFGLRINMTTVDSSSQHGSSRSRDADLESRICGELFYRRTLRWTKVWSVVTNGRLSVFRKSGDKSPIGSVSLYDCTLNSVRREKFGRRRVFRLSPPSGRSLYLQATDQDQFKIWYQILKDETSTYESFQPMSQLYPDSFDVNISDCSMEDILSSTGARTASEDASKTVNREADDISSSDSSADESSTFGAKLAITDGRDVESIPERISKSFHLDSDYTSHWTLDNYFQRHYFLNDINDKHILSKSCESLDSWSTSQGTLTDSDHQDTSQYDANGGLVVRMSTDRSRDESVGEETIFNRHLPGPNNEGLLMVDDEHQYNQNRPASSYSRRISALAYNRHQGAAADYDPQEITTPGYNVPHGTVVAHAKFPIFSPECNAQSEPAPHSQTRVAAASKENIICEDVIKQENEIIHRTSMSESSIPDQKASPQTGSRFRRSFSLNKSLKRYRASFNQLYRQGVKSLDHVEEKCAYLYTLSDRESWQRVWCVSRTPVLEMYSRRDACRPSATINLQQTKAVWLARAGHLGKRYVIGIRADKESHPTFIAMETEDELNDWLTYIKALTDAEVVTETDDNELSKKTKSSEQNGNVLKKDEKRLVSGDDNTLQRTTNEKRQLLLEEVLSNKKLLEQKQKGNRHEQPPERSEETKKAGEDFNKTECVQRLSDGTQDDLVIDKSPECESSSEWKKIILLKRRKVSIELKMESLHRVLHSTRPKEQKKCKSKVLWSEVSVGSKAADVSYRVPDASPEVKHWTLQLAALLREHDEIIDEIQRCQHKHKWYNDATPVETDPSFGRSRSVLVCSENMGSETNISEVNRSTSGGWDGTDVSKDKTLKTQSGTKHNRLERIGKRFSNLPSLMTKKGLLRRGFSVRYDSEGGRNNSNRQKQTSRLFKKSISIDESYVATLSYPWPGEKKDGVDHMIGRRHDPLRASHSSEEYRSQDSTPSGVTSDINLTNQKLDTAELDMTSSEAFYDLTKTLGDVLVFPQNVDRSRDSDRNESEVASGDLKTDQPQTSMADPDTAASFLEGSFDTDSGRGSPMSPEVTEVKASHSQTTNEKHEGRIREETVSKIEAFEGLIREKLGILPNSS